MFGYHLRDHEHYGVVSFNEHGGAVDIGEKPKGPRYNFEIPKLSFYSNAVLDTAKNLKPSPQGEPEITIAGGDLHVAAQRPSPIKESLVEWLGKWTT